VQTKPVVSRQKLAISAAVLALVTAAWQSRAAQQAPAPASPVDFARDIQPIFERSCYSCHGAKSQMGSLRLDSSIAAVNGGVSTHSIVPGKSAESTVYQRVAGIGDQARMPMGGKPLAPAEIELIRKWIDAGAVWPETASGQQAAVQKHWAYIAPTRPQLPAVKNSAWAANPIDRFILARLEKEGLTPSAEADKITLLRRVSLDLVGLPPTIEEVNAFLADKSKDAYAKQVDRLLNSPHYGEKWARQWLDAARYADSDGFEKDKSRQVWFYRDWVINSFNKDLPYDKFIIDQIAGDLLPNATQDQIVATGFLRNSMINEEGGIDPEQFRMEAMFDRMDAVGKAMLGVTIQCAQCHNHKFDPLTQEEYYRLFAFLNNSHEANVAVYTPEEQKKREDVLRRIAAVEARLPKRTEPTPQTQWRVVKPEVDDISTGGQKYLAQADGSLLALGYAPTKHKVKLTFKTDTPVSAFRLELMNDPQLPLGGPGRSVLGTGALSEFEVEAENSRKVKIARASADIELPETPLLPMYEDKSGKKRVTGPVAFAIDGKEDTAWGHDAGPVLRNRPREAVFNLEEPVSGTVVVYLNQRHGGWNSDDNQNYNLGRFRISVTSDADAKARPRQEPMNEELAALWREHPEGSSQLVLRERKEVRPTHVLARGDFLKPTKEITPGVPSFLHSLPKDAPPTRLTFARWLVDKRSPTTARSIVNRVWQAYFGQGLVPSSEDLGKQSEPPSHPELLDWLAVEFMNRGWSLKTLHRSIVTSATYRQTSTVTPELLSRDPYNRLLAHAPRLRVEAEVVRDIALASSGLLNEKVGGPSVFPPAPSFLFEPPASYGPKNWYEDKDEDRYRRALYTFRFRSVPYPMLQTFDAPNGDMSCVRRSRSNTPLQALVTLNEPLFLESARALALRTLESGGSTDTQRLDFAFRRVLARQPSPAERDELLGFVSKQQKRLQEGWLSAPELAGIKDSKVKLPPGATPVQLASWTALSRALFNLDEAITKE
jgi:mono/diheme cytochrome c family protein